MNLFKKKFILFFFIFNIENLFLKDLDVKLIGESFLVSLIYPCIECRIIKDIKIEKECAYDFCNLKLNIKSNLKKTGLEVVKNIYENSILDYSYNILDDYSKINDKNLFFKWIKIFDYINKIKNKISALNFKNDKKRFFVTMVSKMLRGLTFGIIKFITLEKIVYPSVDNHLNDFFKNNNSIIGDSDHQKFLTEGSKLSFNRIINKSLKYSLKNLVIRPALGFVLSLMFFKDFVDKDLSIINKDYLEDDNLKINLDNNFLHEDMIKYINTEYMKSKKIMNLTYDVLNLLNLIKNEFIF